MPRPSRIATCILSLGLPACLRLNPAFDLAVADAGNSGGDGESGLDGTSTMQASGPSENSGGSGGGSTVVSTSTGHDYTSGSALTTSLTSDETSGPDTTGAIAYRRVFITSSVFGANLDGIEGADAKCQAAADAAGLDGTFRAWISTSTSSPMAIFVQSTEPYVRIDGVEVAADWNALIDGDLAAPIEVDEWGNTQDNVECGNVWTNTLRDGLSHDEDACIGWTSLQDAAMLGRSDMSNFFWTEGCIQYCDKQHHLYCFQQ